ncbi:MAG: hypothetical protein FWC89_13980 [Defluviitaleaceae bacterium]|nr:hypothetical protein [Defluviitaleaceae bacterium]
MKTKTILAIVLAIVFSIGLSTVVSATDIVAEREAHAEFFMSLLNEEAATEVNALDYNFALAMVILAEFYDVDSIDEHLAYMAEGFNENPAERIVQFVDFLDDLGLWGSNLSHGIHSERFAFGEDITLENIADVLEAVIELSYLHYDFDFAAIMAKADVSIDEMARFLWVVFESDSDDKYWLMRFYGDSWLYFGILEIMGMFMHEGRVQDDDFVVLFLQTYIEYAEAVKLLGIDIAQDLFEIIDEIAIFVGEDVVFAAVASGQFSSTLERLVEEYGVDGVAALFGTLREQTAPAWLYMDEMLSGLIGEYQDLWWEQYEETRLAQPSSFTREDIADILEEAIAFYYNQHDFDFTVIMEMAEISKDKIVESFVAMHENPDANDWFVWVHGNAWIDAELRHFIRSAKNEVNTRGYEFAVPVAQSFIEHLELIKILGFYEAVNLISMIQVLADELNEPAYMVFASGQASRTLERLVADYGNGFATLLFGEIAFRWSMWNYLDEMMGGLLSENEELFAQLLHRESQSEQVFSDAWDMLFPLVLMDLGGLLSDNEELSAQLWQEESQSEQFFSDAWDILFSLFLPVNYTFINPAVPYEMEHRFSFDIQRETENEIAIHPSSDDRLNIFFENRSDSPVMLFYFLTDLSLSFITETRVAVEAGDSYTTQINFADLDITPNGYWMLHAFVIGNEIDGEFAFRLTEFPLGHPSHVRTLER